MPTVTPAASAPTQEFGSAPPAFGDAAVETVTPAPSAPVADDPNRPLRRKK